MDLDETERYAACALITLALHSTQVEVGVNKDASLRSACQSVWGYTNEEVFDALVTGDMDIFMPPEAQDAFWGWDCCGPQGLCERIYTHFGIPRRRWAGLLKMPEVPGSKTSAETVEELLKLVRRYTAILDAETASDGIVTSQNSSTSTDDKAHAKVASVSSWHSSNHDRETHLNPTSADPTRHAQHTQHMDTADTSPQDPLSTPTLAVGFYGSKARHTTEDEDTTPLLAADPYTSSHLTSRSSRPAPTDGPAVRSSASRLAALQSPEPTKPLDTPDDQMLGLPVSPKAVLVVFELLNATMSVAPQRPTNVPSWNVFKKQNVSTTSRRKPTAPGVRFYDARARVAVKRVCRWLRVPWRKLHAFELFQATTLLQLPEDCHPNFNRVSQYKWLKVAAAMAGGGALLAVTGGLAAPAIAAGLGAAVTVAGGTAAAAAGVHAVAASVPGVAAVSGTFGLLGGGHAGRKMAWRVEQVTEFGFWDISESIYTEGGEYEDEQDDGPEPGESAPMLQRRKPKGRNANQEIELMENASHTRWHRLFCRHALATEMSISATSPRAARQPRPAAFKEPSLTEEEEAFADFILHNVTTHNCPSRKTAALGPKGSSTAPQLTRTASWGSGQPLALARYQPAAKSQAATSLYAPEDAEVPAANGWRSSSCVTRVGASAAGADGPATRHGSRQGRFLMAGTAATGSLAWCAKEASPASNRLGLSRATVQIHPPSPSTQQQVHGASLAADNLCSSDASSDASDTDMARASSSEAGCVGSAGQSTARHPTHSNAMPGPTHTNPTTSHQPQDTWDPFPTTSPTKSHQPTPTHTASQPASANNPGTSQDQPTWDPFPSSSHPTSHQPPHSHPTHATWGQQQPPIPTLNPNPSQGTATRHGVRSDSYMAADQRKMPLPSTRSMLAGSAHPPARAMYGGGTGQMKVLAAASGGQPPSFMSHHRLCPAPSHQDGNGDSSTASQRRIDELAAVLADASGEDENAAHGTGHRAHSTTGGKQPPLEQHSSSDLSSPLSTSSSAQVSSPLASCDLSPTSQQQLLRSRTQVTRSSPSPSTPTAPARARTVPRHTSFQLEDSLGPTTLDPERRLRRCETSMTAHIGKTNISVAMREWFHRRTLRPLLPTPVNHSRRGDASMTLTIAVTGWATRPADFVEPFRSLLAGGRGGDRFTLVWETAALRALGEVMINLVTNKVAEEATRWFLSTYLYTGLSLAVAMPWSVMSFLNGVIDNKWQIVLGRARRAGKMLAYLLIQRFHGDRPVTLVGCSMGARLIFHCLLELSRRRAHGIVENVVLLGTPVSVRPERWAMARSVVAGRFVNGYSTRDWLLGICFRTNSKEGLLKRAGGSVPIELPGIENVNLSRFVTGHLEYLTKMEQILEMMNLTDI